MTCWPSTGQSDALLLRRSHLIRICALVLLLLTCLPQIIYAEENLFGMEEHGEQGPKSWSREELDALKDQIKDDYKIFYAARDFWSSLQLEAWIKAQGADIKYTSPIGEHVIGNPLYGFPQNIRNYYDFKDFTAVVANNRVHFIDPTGKPVRASVQLPFYARQSAITPDARYIACMEARTTGDAPNLFYYWRVGLTDTQSGEHLIKTDWMAANQALNHRLAPRGGISPDGSSIAVCIRGLQRQQDFVMLVTGDERKFIAGLRNVVAVGNKGSWIIGRDATKNHWTLLQNNGKRTPLRNVASCNGHVIIQSWNTKDLYYLHPDGNSQQLPLAGHKDMGFWAFDNYLVARLGLVEIKVPDETDLFGNVTKKGENRTVSKTAVFRWSDLALGTVKSCLDIEGGIVLNNQRHDCLLSWNADSVTLHDCTGDEIKSGPFIRMEKNIHEVQVRDNGIRVVTSDYHNHMLNYYGKKIWSGGTGYIKMIHPMVMAYEKANKNEKGDVINYDHELVQFYANGDTHSVKISTPKNGLEYDVAVDHYKNFGRLFYDHRNWLYFDLNEGKIIRNGHVDEKAETVSQWSFPVWDREDGRYNFYAGRLIPKSIYKEQPDADIWIPRDAMYTRRGLMVMTENHKLQNYDKDMELVNTYENNDLHWHTFEVQDKDVNTYICGWIDNQRQARYIIDKSGKLRQLKEAVPVTGQDPEGEWQVRNRHIYLPRQGSTYWPEEKIGFMPARIRSRSGMPNLLLITRSVLIELEPSIIKKIFPR